MIQELPSFKQFCDDIILKDKMDVNQAHYYLAQWQQKDAQMRNQVYEDRGFN